VRVGVSLFARYREATGRERLEVEIPEDGTVDMAWAAVTARYPVLAEYRPFTLFAIGNEYVAPDHRLRGGDELSVFPPVSGGSGSECGDGAARVGGAAARRGSRRAGIRPYR
jgi:molybdopterin converting factor small subunit